MGEPRREAWQGKSVPFFCLLESRELQDSCGHDDCVNDPNFRCGDEVLIAMATTCSNRAIELSAEIALRKRYPSKKYKRPTPKEQK